MVSEPACNCWYTINPKIRKGCPVHGDGSIPEIEIDETDLVYRLRKRAEIRRQIPSRKSVAEGKPDRMADLLDEAAAEIERLRGVSPAG